MSTSQKAKNSSKTRLGFITRGYKSKNEATLPTPEAKELQNELNDNAEKDSVHHVTVSMLILLLRTGSQTMRLSSRRIISCSVATHHSAEQGEAINRDLSEAYGQWSDECFH